MEIYLAVMYFTSATLYRAPLDDEFCTSPLDFPIHLCCEQVQDFNSYWTELYNAVFSLLEKVKHAATATSGTPRDDLIA